ncbi:glycosyltransferase 1 domain-containing protein 1 [Ciona intestinalis]
MRCVVILSPLLPCSGNTSTVGRISEHFTKRGIECISCTPAHFVAENKCSVKLLNLFIKEKCADALLLLHAVKSGVCLRCRCNVGCKLLINYGIVFGGTDINEDRHNGNKQTILKDTIKGSVFCVAFTEDLRQIALTICPKSNIHVHPQAVDYTMFKSPAVSGNTPDLKDPILFVLPSNIRPVKNPLYLLEDFWKWSVNQRPKYDIRLLVIGNILDEEYSKIFFQKLSALKLRYCSKVNVSPEGKQTQNLQTWLARTNGDRVLFFPAVPRHEFQKLLSKSTFAVVNTSNSEGMASSLLEAMSMNIPVLAHDIPGNSAVINHDLNGCLFSNPDEFIFSAMKLITDKEYRISLITAAQKSICNVHNPYLEAEFYMKLFEKHFSVL